MLKTFHSKKLVKYLATAGIVAASVIAVFSSSSVPAVAKSAAKPSLSGTKLFFQNAIHSTSPGNYGTNILGYFVTICADDNGKPGTPYGTAFTTEGSSLGRAGYSIYDQNGYKLPDQTTQSVDLRGKVQTGNGGFGHDALTHLNAMLDKKEYDWICIEELICPMRATGGGCPNLGATWTNNQLSGRTPIVTQVRFTNGDPSTSSVLHDLGILNNSYTYADARAADHNSELQTMQICGTNIVNKNGTSILSVDHYGYGSADDHDTFGGGYNRQYGFMANLNVTSFCIGWLDDVTSTMAHDCYTPFLEIKLGGKTETPVPPTQSKIVIPVHENGALSARATGYSVDLNAQTDSLYSGELGRFDYNYMNVSYRSTIKTKYTPAATEDNPKPQPGTYDQDQPVNCNLHGTSFTSKAAHSELNTSTFVPAAQSGFPFGVNWQGLASLFPSIPTELYIGEYDELGYPLAEMMPSNERETGHSSEQFRVNYNTYNTYFDDAGNKVVPGRADILGTRKNDSLHIKDISTLKIIPSDVEAYDITLKDAQTGQNVDTPYVGEYLIPVYHYRNNTGKNVISVAHGEPSDDHFLTSTANDFSAFVIGGNGGTQTKEGKSFRLLKLGNQSEQSFTLSCSVWLSDFDRDASWESDAENNIFSKKFTVENPLTGWFIEPNSDYREDTDVVSTFELQNFTGYDIHNADAIQPFVTITYQVNGKTQSQQVRASESVVCPGQSEPGDSGAYTIFWFKWHVPHGALGNVDFSVQMDPDKNFIDMSPWGDPRVNGSWTIDHEIVCESPDTAFAEEPPKWYDPFEYDLDASKSAVTNKILNTGTWTVYQDNGGSFSKKSFNVMIPSTFCSYIEPTGSVTATWSNNKWYMKSGYGFSLTTTDKKVNADAGVTTRDYTDVQNVYCQFPEFMYDTKIGKTQAGPFFNGRFGFKQPSTINWDDKIADRDYNTTYGTYGTITALRRTNRGGFTFPVNSAMANNVHYTPDWEPDGSYRVINYAYDVWTPAGMMSQYSRSNEIRIRGVMYSDYYIAGN